MGAVSRDTERGAGVLATIPLLSHVDTQRREQLFARTSERRYGPGETICALATPALRLPLLVEGTLVAVRSTPDGRELRLGEFTAPCAIDKTAVLDGAGHTATFRARAGCTVWFLNRPDFLSLIDDVAALRRHVLRHLASSVREQQERLVETVFADAATRVAAWLVRAANTRVPLPAGSQEGLAQALGLTRVTVNRALKTLEREGLICPERRAVTVLAPEVLAARVTR